MKNLIRFALAGAVLCMASLAVADTTTTRMGLVKPTIGSTGWGVKTNNNWDTVASTAAALYQSNVFKSTNQFDGATIFSLSAVGQLPYMASGGLMQFLAAGTTGYVLQSGGNGAPSWVSLAGAGTVSGTGANTRLAYWTGTTSIGSTSTLTFNGTTLTAPAIAAATGSFTNVNGTLGAFGAIQPVPAGGSLVFQSTTGNTTATLYSTGTLTVGGNGMFSGFVSSDIGMGVGTATGTPGFNVANSIGQTLGIFVGGPLVSTTSFVSASVIQSTVPVRIITDPTLTTAAVTLSGTQAAFGSNSVVGSYSVATASGVFVSGSGSNSLIQGNLSVGGTLAATTISGSGAGITSISGSNVAGGTFGTVVGSALTALTAANITAGGTLPALNGAALTSLTAANITAAGTLPALNGAALTSLTAANIASGTLGSGVLISTVPALNGSLLTNLTAANVTGSHTLPDSVLSTNVPLLNASPQTFTGSNNFGFVQVGTSTSYGQMTVLGATSQTNSMLVGHGAVADLTVSTNGVVAVGTGGLTVNGTAAATTFSGSGASLTNLPAASLTGSIADARLSANVPLLNASNAFTGTNNSFVLVQAGTTTSGGVMTVAAVASQTNTLYVTHGGAAPDMVISTNGVIAIEAGSGTATFSPGGILDQLIISSGMAAGVATETTLYTTNIQANTLVSTAAVNGAKQEFHIFASGNTANATLERIRVYFGSTVCADSGNQALNGSAWRADCYISQIGAGATQAGSGVFLGGTSLLAITDTSPTETITGAINVKVTGTVSVATANGVLVRKAFVKKE